MGKPGREQTTDVVRDSGAKSIFFCSRPNFRAFKMRKKLFLRKAGRQNLLATQASNE